MKKNLRFGSLCAQPAEKDFQYDHPHIESIVPTTTYSYTDPEALMRIFLGEEKGFIYSRWSNPTIELAEEKLAALEACGLKDAQGNPLTLRARLFSSGMGAISALFMSNLKTGDQVISQGNLYGGTTELLTKILSNFGIEPVFVQLKDLNLVEDHLKKYREIKMIYVETPSNPTIDVYDIGGLALLSKKYNKLIAVDNTFATPYLQQPFQFEVDFVVHSTTKYLNGHGNSTSGTLISRHLDFMEKNMLQFGKLLGANSNAFDAWLLLQGVKTLEIRMQRHCSNAMQIATFLEKHDKVSKVNYAGLPLHAGYEVAKKQMSGFSGMMSFELAGGLEAGKKLLKHTAVCRLAVSLGTVDTIIQHPASMSHVGVPKEQREQNGITDGLIRLSVGIEDVNDLIEDLGQALEKV